MTRKLLIDALKILVPFILVMTVFTFYPMLKGVSIDIPVEEEERLGDLIMDQLFEENEVHTELEDSIVDRAILRIEGRLVQEVGMTEFEHDIRVIENDMVNAFTLPGGNILVCSGLIEFAETPEEVASVIAHEIGHVEERHVIQRLKREFGKAVIMSVLGDPGGGAILREMGSSSLSASFDREQERQADDHALRLMEKSGIAPHHMGTLFRRMKEEKYTGEQIPEMLKSHPDLNSRIKKAFEYEAEKGFEAEPIELRTDWEEVQERVGSDR